MALTPKQRGEIASDAVKNVKKWHGQQQTIGQVLTEGPEKIGVRNAATTNYFKQKRENAARKKK